MIFALILALLVGMSLRLLGTGGAILGLPILIYIAGLSPVQAIPLSLLTVGLVSVFSLINTHKNIQYKLLIYIIPVSFAGIYTGAHIAGLGIVSEDFRLVFFGLCASIAGVLMLRNNNFNNSSDIISVGPQHNYLFYLLIYILTSIAGFIGIGGGFALVPLLVLYKKLNYQIAAPTALVLVCLNSLTGFILYYLQGVSIPWDFGVVYILIAIAGIYIGAYISRQLDCSGHRRIFGIFIICVSVYTIIRSLLS